jgi:hypothetical protein
MSTFFVAGRNPFLTEKSLSQEGIPDSAFCGPFWTLSAMRKAALERGLCMHIPDVPVII